MLDWMYEDPETAEMKAKDKIYHLYPERYEVISQWARNGCTKQEIAAAMGISYTTLMEWEKRCSDISKALKEARAYAHARVENALFKKAVGFTIREMVPVKKKVKDFEGAGNKVGEHEEIEMMEVIKEIPPDMGAIAFYLKNNMPDKYKDKWPERGDESDEEAGRICMKVFAKAVAAAGEMDES